MHASRRFRDEVVKSTSVQNAMDDVEQDFLSNWVTSQRRFAGRDLMAHRQIGFEGLIARRVEPTQDIGWTFEPLPLLVQLGHPGVVKQSNVDLLHFTREVALKLFKVV